MKTSPAYDATYFPNIARNDARITPRRNGREGTVVVRESSGRLDGASEGELIIAQEHC